MYFFKENENYKKNKLNNLFKLFHKFIFLNSKVVYFFFNLLLVFTKNHKDYSKKINLSYFYFIYKILFFFLKSVSNILQLLNLEFKKDGKYFFPEKKYLLEFLLFYKFYLYNIFFNKNNKFFNFFIKFNFKVYSNYLLYSIYFFLNLYLEKLKKLKEKKIKIEISYPDITLIKLEESHLFYKNFIMKSSKNKINLDKFKPIKSNNISLSLFLDNRTNFPTVDDNGFSKILGCLRRFIRIYYINGHTFLRINSFSLMDTMIKKAVPVSKIIHQRRGRIFIPLRTYYFSQLIRNSLGMKFIYTETSNIHTQKKMSFEQKLLITLLNILTMKKSYIYQHDKSRDIRKKASNRNYYLKILKSYFGNM